jgi:hypothetical protein
MNNDNITKHQFKKGQSGNPNGRPKGSLNSKTILQRFLDLKTEATNPITNELENLTVAEQIHLVQIANAIAGDLYSYKEIIDRLEGKTVAVQEIKQEITQKTLRVGYGDIENEDDDEEFNNG